MQEDIKKGFSIEGKHFIFRIGPSYKHKSWPYLLRTGVKWQSLLGTLISVPELKKVFWEELAKVCEHYPQLEHRQRHRINKGQLMPGYNYIAPEQSWINEFPFDRASLIQNFIPRFRQLLVEQVLPYWIVVQIIPPLLALIAKAFSEENAMDLGQRFLKATVEAFQSTRQTFSGNYQYENFYSFVLNLLQESFQSKNYAISVSKTLVDYRIPVTFLRDVYALHPKNNAALDDLWQWFLEDKDFFGENFDKYWHARGYQKSEIESFKQDVIPVLPPDEDCEDMPEPYPQPLQASVSTPVRWVSTSSPAESLTSSSSFSSYFFPSSPMYFFPAFQLTPPHVSQYQVFMQKSDFMLEPVPSMPCTSIEESKSNRTPTTILQIMRTSYSSNQQGFLVGRNKEQDQSNVGDYYHHRY